MSEKAAQKPHGFPKQARVRTSAEFDCVFASKVYAADDVLVMNGCRNELGRSRLGLSVSRKVGNAVVRNHWKRLIREAFRMQQSDLPQGFDIVVRPRRGAVAALPCIRSSLRSLARRIAQKLPERAR